MWFVFNDKQKIILLKRYLDALFKNNEQMSFVLKKLYSAKQIC